MRISGFASGLDIDQIVKDLMKAKRVGMDKLTQKRTTLEWQQEQYRSVNIKLVDFRNNKLFNYGMGEAISAKQVNTTGNTSAVSVKATSAAVQGNMSIEVTQLATAATLSSGATGIGTVDSSQSLSALKAAGKINYTAVGGVVSFNVNGTNLSLNETDSLSSLVSVINGSSTANANAFLDSATGKLSITSKTMGASSTLSVSGDIFNGFNLVNSGTSGYVSSSITKADGTKTLADLKTEGKINYTLVAGKVEFVINGTTIQANETDSLNSTINVINSTAAANVNATFDTITGKLSIVNKTQGSPVTLSSPFFDSFNVAATGKDAFVKINGISTTRSSNSFTENGVEITLNATSGGNATNLNVVSNTDKIVDTVKSFIKDYNELLDLMNGKLTEERYRKFTPLTSEQRAEMKDDEIKLWEEKAKSGLLKNDTTLSQAVSNMRLAAITDVTVNGQQVNLTSLGITTGDWTQRGKLVIQDEAKLRAAIEANPQQVMGFFTQKTTETDPKLRIQATTPDNGLFNRLSNVAMAALEGMAEKAGTSKYSTDTNVAFMATSLIGEQLREIDIKIGNESSRLTMLETSYYKKFTAMESAINRYSSQSTGLFGASQ